MSERAGDEMQRKGKKRSEEINVCVRFAVSGGGLIFMTAVSQSHWVGEIRNVRWSDSGVFGLHFATNYFTVY